MPNSLRAPDEAGQIIPLPSAIEVGVMNVSRRNGWNKAAPEPFALPTETWREHVARRQRCLEIRDKLQRGEVHQINDLITLNLDIWQFARDAIVNSEGPELLRAFWHTLTGRIPEKSNEKIELGITVLDPTCGSGAFLFAALRILETLYSDCLERMKRFVEDLAVGIHHPEKFKDFRSILADLQTHPNERYYILKSIIIHNLYGVDIMEEAVEICKLRLFLKLVAQVDSVEQIEPLPDIDFNIRAGNTLIGYTSLEQVRQSQKGKLGFEAKEIELIDNDIDAVEGMFRLFQRMQTRLGGRVTAEDKEELRAQLAKLSEKLNRYLAGEYGVDVERNDSDYLAWKTTHQPFHWLAQFYGIMRKGGFDIIIGNPPYLELREITYSPWALQTLDTAAVHAMCIERSLAILHARGSISMIVPLALVSTQRMNMVQKLIERHASVWYANFAWRPGKLFDTVNRALTIFVACRVDDERIHSTNYQKWNSDTRNDLLPTIAYCEVQRHRPAFWIPKLGFNLEQVILAKLLAIQTRISDFTAKSVHLIYYRTTGGLYWKVFTDFAPDFKCNGARGRSSRETTMGVSQGKYVKPCIAALSSNLFWWWYTVTSNLRDLNPSDIREFPLPESVLNDKHFAILGDEYMRNLQRNSTMLVRQQKQTGKTETQCFKIQMAKPILDEIDTVLAQHYGFTPEELDFIINYDIKYRMGQDNGSDADEE